MVDNPTIKMRKESIQYLEEITIGLGLKGVYISLVMVFTILGIQALLNEPYSQMGAICHGTVLWVILLWQVILTAMSSGLLAVISNRGKMKWNVEYYNHLWFAVICIYVGVMAWSFLELACRCAPSKRTNSTVRKMVGVWAIAIGSMTTIGCLSILVIKGRERRRRTVPLLFVDDNQQAHSEAGGGVALYRERSVSL